MFNVITLVFVLVNNLDFMYVIRIYYYGVCLHDALCIMYYVVAYTLQMVSYKLQIHVHYTVDTSYLRLVLEEYD